MKTPTTVTVAVWNYCQNRCEYCVSNSNLDCWKVGSKSKVWKPAGDEHLNFYQLCEKHGFDYHDRMCPVPGGYFSAKDVLEYRYAIDWIKRHRPGAHVHLSGGEPLLRPDIVQMVESFSSEFETTIVTNGQLIPQRTELLGMPVKWLVTWHREQISMGQFLSAIEPIRNKPHLIKTIIGKYDEPEKFNSHFEGFNFECSFESRPRMDRAFKHNDADFGDIASHRILLIQPNGPVVSCNKPHGGPFHRYKSPSNVYAMTCDEGDLAANNKRADECIKYNACGAYQTAVKMARIKADG